MKNLTCKKINYLLKDEAGATKEYRDIGTHVKNLNKRQKATFKAMSREEHGHHQNLMKLKAEICKR
jgi:hypothetical protein